ncbi:hypothetical protein RvY_01907 [Ramazzottius varieornatus]|uniref:Peptidase S1 domain-containing protein n=1 Tax=Ramazzottius varieornatus TaxID=947166 RepID=A0A1D1ULD1_RAMVA|nr:hypothetical protein RvY_01907 [Ramazzottius varieornatus]
MTVTQLDMGYILPNIPKLPGPGCENSPLLRVADKKSVECGQDDFVCPSDASKCIQADKMCDGYQDCPKGEDEICTEDCGNAGAANKKGKLSGKIVGGAEPPSYTDRIQPICLAQKPAPPPGTSCFITGWGREVPETIESESRNLMEADVKLWSDEECSADVRVTVEDHCFVGFPEPNTSSGN